MSAATPVRVQMTRHRPWRPEHPDAVIVARPSRWGNPFRVGHTLMRVPAALDTGAECEYDGRISAAPGTRHDYHHPDGQVTACVVRRATAAECVDLYRRLLTGDLTPAMLAAGWRPGLPAAHPSEPRLTVENARRALAGRDLACWCSPGSPCHADVLLEIAAGGVS